MQKYIYLKKKFVSKLGFKQTTRLSILELLCTVKNPPTVIILSSYYENHAT